MKHVRGLKRPVSRDKDSRMHTLHVLPYSPWSERARWALLHHRLAFREHEHVPLIGEFALRLRSGVWKGRVSVPLLCTSAGPVRESLAIAEYAETHGSGPPLFPASVRDAITSLDAQLEPVIDTGRASILLAIKEHDDAAIASLPKALRWVPLGAMSARLGTRFVASKYGTTAEELHDRFHAGLRSVESTLGGRDYVHDTFTYADIVCASAMQFVNPIDDRYIPLEPAMRARFTRHELVRAFPALFEWRSALYAKHRRVAAPVV